MENPQVFISYAHLDEEWVKSTLLPKLAKADLKCRIDSQIHLGTSIYDWIDSSRNECKAFILVISNNYLKNRSYARAEMTDLIIRSLKGRIRVVPVYKEPVDEDDLPFGLPSLNSIDYTDSLDTKLSELAAELQKEPRSRSQASQSTQHRFVPPERRIRIQAATDCTQQCPWCHWDDFPRNLEAPNYRLVHDLMVHLKEARDKDVVTYPRPNISFALTGGEPLINDTWKNLASVDPQNTFLLTNAYNLDKEAISFINKNSLKGIRIDLPLIIPSNDFRGIISKTDGVGIGEYYAQVIKNIKALLSASDAEVRFNYVITSEDLAQINNYLQFIRTTFPDFNRKKTKGVAFIERYPYDQTPLDIFKVAKKWVRQADRKIKRDSLVPRKMSAKTEDEILIEFIKLNCAITDDLISRCFKCVQEQDIAISADGRIRICSGWDAETEIGCHYIYTHFEPTQPLVGISGAIRRRYGIAGFYCHFNIISNIVSGKPIPNFLGLPKHKFVDSEFKDFAADSDLDLDDEEIRDFTFVPYLAKKILGEDPPFQRLYEEGTIEQKHLENSITLCCHLLRAAYSVANSIQEKKQDVVRKVLLNQILLLLEYLCVDESLFSTGRTLMVQGMSTDLLRGISRSLPNPNFLADSSYCLAAVASESCDADVVLQFLKSQLPGEDAQKVAWVQYLIGSLYKQSRRPGGQDKAIKALELAYLMADKQIQAGAKSAFIFLLKEIRAEAKRSLGAIRKERPEEIEQAQKDFALANFLSSVDNTRLRYACLFSDGYAAMQKYFREEMGKTEFRREAYKAHRDFSESISLNPTFYASLIRMALLELALGHTDVAVERLRIAKRSFSKRGLLTDQEYLNSILCDLIYIVATDPPDANANMPQVWSLGIADCKTVGTKDALCVKEDAGFLLSTISNMPDDDKKVKLEERGILNEVKTFISHCARLAER